MAQFLFDSDIASALGLHEAIVLERIRYLVTEHACITIDGSQWWEHSLSQWCSTFPFIGRTKLYAVLKELQKKKLIVVKTHGLGSTRGMMVSVSRCDTLCVAVRHSSVSRCDTLTNRSSTRSKRKAPDGALEKSMPSKYAGGDSRSNLHKATQPKTVHLTRIRNEHEGLRVLQEQLVENAFLRHVDPWTNKDRVFMKQYLRKAGEHALQALKHLCKNWPSLSAGIAGTHGEKTPPRPSPGYLAKFSQDVVSAYLGSKERVAPKVKSVARKIGTLYTAAHVQKERPATVAEIDAIEWELRDKC
jgi:hypothetical protein